MKIQILSVFAAFTLSAVALSGCATGPTAFGPAQSNSGLGFTNTQIQNDRFRVGYTASSRNEAQDFALLRAAQITLDEGYSHFKIIDGRLSGAPRSGVNSSIGIGLSNGARYRRGGTSVGVGLGLNDVVGALEGERVTSSIEIRLLRSGAASGTVAANDIYDAKSITDSIRPQAFSTP